MQNKKIVNFLEQKLVYKRKEKIGVRVSAIFYMSLSKIPNSEPIMNRH